ncbi:MAG: hypothetical protein IKO72_01585 [Kiritimatiellae bacterium]|nr:hypothetical protein [Kiritimatiellia bacterium]
MKTRYIGCMMGALALSMCAAHTAKAEADAGVTRQVVGPWTFSNYRERLSFATNTAADDVSCFVVRGSTNVCDTAWRVNSAKIAIPKDAREFLLSLEVRSFKPFFDLGKSDEGWNNAIAWYGADGGKISAQPIPRLGSSGGVDFRRVREWGEIPAGAVSCTVQFGFDRPDIGPGKDISFRNVVFETYTAARSRRAEFEKLQQGDQWLVDLLYPKPRPTQKVTLRDDGMTLIDGKPFFPIGIYSVCKREFNGNSFDKAFAGLQAAGFNLAHTYGNSWNPEFLDAARKYGFKLWVSMRMPDRNLLEIGRYNPSIIAWYLGDDTAEYQTSQELSDVNAAVKAVDPTRLTCQADGVRAERSISSYAGYVRGTDVFMPEIYPVRGKDGDKSDATCVAATIRDMMRIASDVRLFAGGQTKGCWPIIQYFKGWGSWEHFPTRDQLNAMTWAAIIHGAHGMTWYTYGGFEDKKKNRKNEGVTSTPERWQTICELAGRLRDLSPVLVERKPQDQPTIEILSGPAKDPLGTNPSVTAMLKRHEGKAYVFAVNACPEPVKARISWTGGGNIVHEFPPFGVLIQ